MPLRECIRSHSHREYVAWQKWLDDQQNVPSRSDWYLMRIAQRIYQGMLSKRPADVTLDQQRIYFERQGDSSRGRSSGEDREEFVKKQSSLWRRILGKNIRRREEIQ